MFKRIISGIAVFIGIVIPSQAKAEIDDFEGYQGFVETGYTFGTGSYGLNSIDILTSHGVQILPTYLFTGIGAGLQYFHEADKYTIPLFVNVRSCLLAEENVSPFADIKIGYAAVTGNSGYISGGGLFLSPMFGCTFVLRDFIALNAGVGYTFEQVKVAVNADKSENIGGFFLRLGIQF